MEQFALEKKSHFWLLLALILPTFMMGVDMLIIGVAIAPMSISLHASMSVVQWLITAFAIGDAAFLVNAGRLCDLYGCRSILILGVFLFGVSSLLIGLSGSIWIVIIMRFIQGASGGIMATTAISAINKGFSPERRQAWVAATIASAGIGMALGPTLGGCLIEFAHWRFAFFINVPISLIAGYAAWRIFPSKITKEESTLDLAGMVFFLMAIVLLVVLISHAFLWGYTLPTQICLVSLIASVILLVFVEKRASHPLIDLSLLATQNYLVASMIGFIIYFVLMGNLLVWGIYLDKVFKMSPLLVGFYFLPIGLMMVVGSFVVKYFRVMMSMKWLLGLSSVLGAMGCLDLTVLTPGVSYWQVLLGFLLLGLSIAVINAVTLNVGLMYVEPEKAGLASGKALMIRWLGGALGSAILATVLTSVSMSVVKDQPNAALLKQAILLPGGINELKQHAELAGIFRYSWLTAMRVSQGIMFVLFLVSIALVYFGLREKKAVDHEG